MKRFFAILLIFAFFGLHQGVPGNLGHVAKKNKSQVFGVLDFLAASAPCLLVKPRLQDGTDSNSKIFPVNERAARVFHQVNQIGNDSFKSLVKCPPLQIFKIICSYLC